MLRLPRTLRGLRIITVLCLVLLGGAIASDAGAQVYVANSLNGTLSVINSVTNTVTKTITLQQFPFAVAVHPNGSRVYVTNGDTGTVSVIDAANNTVIGNPIFVGSPARGLAVSPDGQFVHVVAAGMLVSISTATHTPSGSPVGLGTGAYGIAVAPNGQFAYVTDKDQNVGSSVNIVNLSTRSVVGQAVGGSLPRAAAVRPDGQFVYVTAFQDGALQVFQASNNEYKGGGCAGNFCLHSGPIGVAVSADNGFAFTANSNLSSVSIFRLDPLGGLPTSGPVDVALPSPGPQYLDVTPDGKFLYVSHGPNSVSVIDLKATPASVVKTIMVGSGPQGVAVSPLASGPPPPPPPPPPRPPALSASLEASPGTVTVGQSFTVTMMINNTGGSAANNVAPSPLTPSGTGGAIQTSGPSPASATINAGGSQPFAFTYSASVAGTIAFSGNASGGGVSSATATSNTVTIQSSPPTLTVAPGSFNFVGEQGLGDPSGQSAQISNTGGGTLGWSIAPGTTNGRNWLSASPASGSAPPTASASVVAGTCGLPAGAYHGLVVFSAGGANGSPQSIPVTLTVTQPGATPSLPLARVCTDRPTYHGGDTLTLSASVRSGAGSNTGDAYLYAAVPGTTLFASLVLSQGGFGIVVGPAPVPLAQNFQAFDFAGSVFQQALTGSEPTGTYQLTATLVPPGADPLVPANRIAASVSQFALAP